MERFTMPSGLVDEVCAALGTSTPTDRVGIDELYRSWCARFPFDPVAKATAMAEGRTPPGADPIEVAERWLTTGLGSTCWGQVAVLGAILDQAGVAVRVGLDRMLTDEVVDFHAFVVVDVDGSRLLLDPVHPSGGALALEAGAVGTHPAYAAGLDLVDGRLEHWYTQPDGAHRAGRYAVLSTDLDAADTRAFLAVSAMHSGVGRRFFNRRTPPDRFVVTRPTEDGRALRSTTWTSASGRGVAIEHHDLDDAIAAVGYTSKSLGWLTQSGLLTIEPEVRWAV